MRVPTGALLEAYHPAYARARAWVTPAVRATGRVRLQLGTLEPGVATDGLVLDGSVVDAGGAPVAGARVTVEPAASTYPAVLPGSEPPHETVSDADGHFRVEGLAAGAYDVRASVLGRAPARVRDVAAGSRGLLLRLLAGVHIEGSVRDESGSPVPSFSVAVRQYAGPLQLLPYAQRQVVDAGGQYVVHGLLPGRYSVEVTALGYAPAEAQVLVGEQETGPVRLDLTLSRGARLTGEVVRKGTGEPIPDARVELISGADGAALLASSSNSIRTDARGGFVLEGLPPGPLTLAVSAEGHHPRVLTELSLGEGERAFQRIELKPVGEGETPQLERVGIGVSVAPREDALVVGGVAPGGGADSAGVIIGDGIVRIEGVPVVDLGFREAVSRLRGREGSQVRLGIRGPNSPEVKEVVVVRRRM